MHNLQNELPFCGIFQDFPDVNPHKILNPCKAATLEESQNSFHRRALWETSGFVGWVQKNVVRDVC